MIVVPKLSRLAQLDAIVAAQLNGGSLKLFQNDLTPTPDTLLAAFTVADFAGYADKVIAAWGASFLDPPGLATSLAPLQTWTATDAVTPNTIFGVYFLDLGGDLVFAERFAEPVYMAEAGNVLNMVPKYQSGQIPAAA